MSNQIGLMISLIAMIFMILLSGEVICYQYDVARTQAITNQIAIYIQETGADVSEVKKLPIYNDNNYLLNTIKEIIISNKKIIINLILLTLITTIFMCLYSYHFKIIIDKYIRY